MGYETRGEAQDRHVVEISRLLDLLEEQVRTGMRVPLTNRVAVEEEEFLATVDQLRASIPAELRQARRVIQDRQEVILTAQREAERIIATAKERADYLTSSEGVMAEARQRSEDLLRQSRSQSQRSVEEIENYALRIIGQVEQTMRTGLQDLEKGLHEVEQAKRAIGSTRAATPTNNG
jgi:hypothetical protein